MMTQTSKFNSGDGAEERAVVSQIHTKYCRVIVISLSGLLDSVFIVMSNIKRFLEVQGVAVEQRSAPRVGLKLKKCFSFSMI